jgi:hypothetical protein
MVKLLLYDFPGLYCWLPFPLSSIYAVRDVISALSLPGKEPSPDWSTFPMTTAWIQPCTAYAQGQFPTKVASVGTANRSPESTTKRSRGLLEPAKRRSKAL